MSSELETSQREAQFGNEVMVISLLWIGTTVGAGILLIVLRDLFSGIVI